jgi:hypothetical protein
MGAKRNAYRMLMEKPEEKSPLGRSRRRCVDNIKIDLLEISRCVVDWACSTNGVKRNAYRLFIEEPQGKRPLRRARRRWVNNIKIDLLEIVWGGLDWCDDLVCVTN